MFASTTTTATVRAVETNEDSTRDGADDDGEEDGEVEVESVLASVSVSDGEAGVGPGVVAGDGGVVDSGDIEPSLTLHLGRVATPGNIDKQSGHQCLGRAGTGQIMTTAHLGHCPPVLWSLLILNIHMITLEQISGAALSATAPAALARS